MSVRVLDPGLQSTIQAGPRLGRRQFGIPSGGPADPLSHALANRLVGNAPDAPAIETTLTGITLAFEGEAAFALTGAPSRATLNGDALPHHRTLRARPGDVLAVGRAESGARTYLAVAGGFAAQDALGSLSTDLRSGLGGHEGRALAAEDRLAIRAAHNPPVRQTPDALRPPVIGRIALRAVPGPEAARLTPESREALFGEGLKAGRAADRMGVRLSGMTCRLTDRAELDSRPVFPGLVQCPHEGAPLLLLTDGGTTGGYVRAAGVIRADRHLLGQIAPGMPVRLLPWTEEDAVRVLAEKAALFDDWLPGTGMWR